MASTGGSAPHSTARSRRPAGTRRRSGSTTSRCTRSAEDRGDTHLYRLHVDGRDPEQITSGAITVQGFDAAAGARSRTRGRRSSGRPRSTRSTGRSRRSPSASSAGRSSPRRAPTAPTRSTRGSCGRPTSTRRSRTPCCSTSTAGRSRSTASTSSTRRRCRPPPGSWC